ncbi:hypothetical protein E3N88_15585 [Mikania micrantha]|uniref:C2H2-type domain-containing protein n=1 Tax=Mikania micrantha TaxID=192012 RepID=A0A5N6NZ11_9ASTR|nr:hypothetical protein E3N88_15585 [Mikania micrantha]
MSNHNILQPKDVRDEKRNIDVVGNTEQQIVNKNEVKQIVEEGIVEAIPKLLDALELRKKDKRLQKERAENSRIIEEGEEDQHDSNTEHSEVSKPEKKKNKDPSASASAASSSDMISQTANAGKTMSETTSNVIVTPIQREEIRPFKCEVCNITCNTEDLLEKHKKGKKHSKSLQKLGDSSANATKMVPPPVASESLVGDLGNKRHGLVQHGVRAESIHCDLCNVVCYNQEIYQKHVVGKKHSAKEIIQLACKSGFLAPTQYSSSGSQKKLNTFQCELCNITCTSNELLRMHIAGKKHVNKLKEHGQIPNLPIVNSESNKDDTANSDGSNRNGKRAGSHEDVQSKKQRVLQGGAPLNAIRTCTLCNVVCNSPTVFIAHLAGQKHAAMVVKKVETLTNGQES